ncbi:hypothetical protein cypCar_00009605 [Cyprinus carpio]|nr:hypothetical protein cypCar_00009605 [Cyprinus carpio]
MRTSNSASQKNFHLPHANLSAAFNHISSTSTWTTAAEIRDTTEKEFVSVWVRDPQVHKEDFWHAYITYEICLHSQLSIAKIDACSQGQTHYTVAQAIQRCVGYTRFPVEEEHQEDSKTCCDSDCESTRSSGLGNSLGRATPVEEDSSYNESFSHEFQVTTPEAELCSILSSSPSNQ